MIISTNIDILCDSNNWGCVFMNKIPVGQILCFSLFILTFSIQGILWWNRSFCLFTYEICCFSIFKIISNDNHNSWKFEQTQNCRMGRRQKFLSVQYAFYNFFNYETMYLITVIYHVNSFEEWQNVYEVVEI